MAMLCISLGCEIIIGALIIRGVIALPSSIIPFVSAVFAMDLTAVILSLSICISDSVSDASALWLVYLLYMNVAVSASLFELELFKIFTIVTPDLNAQEVTRIQIVFLCIFTLGMAGQCANIFNRGDEPEWLALVYSIDIVASLGHFLQRRSRMYSQCTY